MDNEYLLKLQLIKELENCAKYQRCAQELYDALAETSLQVLDFAVRNNIEPIARNNLIKSLTNTHSLMDLLNISYPADKRRLVLKYLERLQSPTDSEQPNRNNRKGNNTNIVVATTFLVIF